MLEARPLGTTSCCEGLLRSRGWRERRPRLPDVIVERLKVSSSGLNAGHRPAWCLAQSGFQLTGVHGVRGKILTRKVRGRSVDDRQGAAGNGKGSAMRDVHRRRVRILVDQQPRRCDRIASAKQRSPWSCSRASRSSNLVWRPWLVPLCLGPRPTSGTEKNVRPENTGLGIFALWPPCDTSLRTHWATSPPQLRARACPREGASRRPPRSQRGSLMWRG